MSDTSMKDMAEEVSTKTAQKMLIGLGLDIDDPISMQKDMAALRELRELIESEEFKKDMLHLRKWRKAMDSVESKGFLAAIGLVIVGGIAAMMLAFKIEIFGVK